MGKITVYLHYEEGDKEKHTTLKLKLPGSYQRGETYKVKDFFLQTYNKKFPDDTLEDGDVHMEEGSGRVFKSNDICEHVFKNNLDVYIKPGASEVATDEELEAKAKSYELDLKAAEEAKIAKETSTKAAGAKAELSGDVQEKKGSLRCKNYGCNQWFDEADNSDTVCKHHVSPPLFHDAKKGWTCCPKRVYDWEEFQNIEGCTIGRHDTTDPKVRFAPSPTVAAAAAADAAGVASAPSAVAPPPAPTRSIDDYNKKNPDAVTAATSALKSVTKKQMTRRADGTARCLRKGGCQKDFVVAENNDKACRYHIAAPVFHDTGKYWTCCPDKVKYDFDDFMKIPGCTVGSHDDGFEE